MIDRIFEAKRNLDGIIFHTPLITSPFINDLLKKNVFIKLECLQHTGSFKFRGAFNALKKIKKNKIKSVVTYSSGNHGQAISASAKILGINAIVIMPYDAPKNKVEKTKSFGSEIIFFDRKNESREEIGNRISKKYSIPLIKPYDDFDVIAGQGTIGLEIYDQLTSKNILDADVLTCCGGGGLSAGVATALNSKNKNFIVRTCEPDNYDDTKRSLETRERQYVNSKKMSVCDALLSNTPGNLTLPILLKLAGKGLSVNDNEVLYSMSFAFQHLKIVVEPGGAVALAAALFKIKHINSKNVVIVVSGGNVDKNLFKKALRVKID